MYHNILLALTLLLCISCSSGQCRRDGTILKKKEGGQTLTEQEAAEEIVLVSKSDGSRQCGYKIGVKLEDMAEELKGIEIKRMEKKHDGLMRIQTCGAPTGMLNVFHIYRKNVRFALKQGFKVLN